MSMVTTLVFHGLADFSRHQSAASDRARRALVDDLVSAVANLAAGQSTGVTLTASEEAS